MTLSTLGALNLTNFIKEVPMINIDLNRLTREMVVNAIEAIENRSLRLGGRCMYTAPCIIGALMTPKERRVIAGHGHDCSSVRRLSDLSLVSIAEDQEEDAELLQNAFDVANISGLRAIASKYIK